ncbi:hypothetical protein [Streptomyces umbrinus]|uniref:hypothetical protein n=1 Tax=Streptomyces umbrinus TaxID=67370 RepID=UPI00343B4347
MSRRTAAERRRRATERDTRRDSLFVLISRTQRGVPLAAPEADLLRAHVEVEVAESNALRATVAGQQTAVQRMGRRNEAAEKAIREAEQRAANAERKLSESETLGHRLLQRAEAAEQQLPPVEAALAEMRRRHRGASERVDQLLAALARVRNAQSLGDALAAVAEHDGLSPTAARILDRSDSTEARLAEQQRDHDIALAIERRRGDGWKRHALNADHKADRYRTAWFAARRDRRADRAAMAAELPVVQAGQHALAVSDELFVAGSTSAERAAGCRILATTTEQPR